MVNPVLGIPHPIKRDILDIDTLITRIKVHDPDPRNLAVQRIRNIHLLKKRRSDQVHVLSRVGKEAHHDESHEGAHGAAVVVARQSVGRGAEELGDVIVGSFGGQSWPSSVVILEDGEEGRLVADVCDVLVVEIVQAVDEAGWAAIQTDQRSLVVGHIEAVFPDGGLERLGSVVLKGADTEIVVVGAV